VLIVGSFILSSSLLSITKKDKASLFMMMENDINQTTSATTCTAAVNPLSTSSLPLPLSSPASITAPSRSEQHNSNSNSNSQNGESSQKNDSEREIIAKQNQDHAEGNTKTGNNNDINIKDDKKNSTKDPPNPHGSRHQNNSNNNNNNKRRRGRKQPTSVKVITPVEGCSVCKIFQEDAGPPKYKCPKCRASYCSVACCRQHKTVCPGKDNGGPTTATTTTTTTIPGATTAAASSINFTIVNNNTINHGNDNDSEEEYDDDDDDSLEEGFKITEDMKNALRKSTWLRNELQDGGLRDMISSVVRSEKKFKKSQNNNNNRNRNHKFSDNNRKQQQQQHCPHPHDELAAKRQDNQNFDVFVDKLLVLGDVLERRQGDIVIREDGSTGGVVGGIKGTDIPPRRNEEELEEWLKRKWDHGDPPQDLTLKPRPRKLKLIPKFEPVDVSSSEEEDEDEDMNDSKDLKDDEE
jgi:hypothetical protein